MLLSLTTCVPDVLCCAIVCCVLCVVCVCVCAAEDAERFSVFQQSLHRVVAKNDALKARGLGPNYGMNRFSDLEPKEWAEKYLSKDVTSARKAALLANAPVAHPTKRVDAMPSDLDYRETNPVGVTSVFFLFLSPAVAHSVALSGCP